MNPTCTLIMIMFMMMLLWLPGTARAEMPSSPPSLVTVDRESPRDLDGLAVLAPDSELELDAVLESLEQHPLLDQADAKIAEAEGKHLSAEGAFDTQLGSKASVLPVGYYDPVRLDVEVEQPTTLWGTRFYAGYRLGVGDGPAYDGKKETLAIGELRAGFEIPLWAGGPIDEARAAIAITESEIEYAEALRQAKRIELAYKARAVYAKWLVAGQQLVFAEQLRDYAQVRLEALERQVEQGLVAEIEVTDMRRTLLEREAKVVTSRQKLESAALSLAFYHRDSAGRSIVPGRGQLPPGWVSPAVLGATELVALREEARTARPEYQALRQRMEQLQVELELFDNKLAPKIDLSGEVLQDFGSGDHLSVHNTEKSKGSFEVSVGLSVQWSFQQREARGKLDAASAALSQMELELQVLDEQVALEIQEALLAYDAAVQVLDASRESFEAARALEDAARRTYALGSTSLLEVYQREQSTIKAFDGVLEAWLALHVAVAALEASLGRTW